MTAADTTADTTADREGSIDPETTVDPETAGQEGSEESTGEDPFDVPTPGGLRALV